MSKSVDFARREAHAAIRWLYATRESLEMCPADDPEDCADKQYTIARVNAAIDDVSHVFGLPEREKHVPPVAFARFSDGLKYNLFQILEKQEIIRVDPHDCLWIATCDVHRTIMHVWRVVYENYRMTPFYKLIGVSEIADCDADAIDQEINIHLDVVWPPEKED